MVEEKGKGDLIVSVKKNHMLDEGEFGTTEEEKRRRGQRKAGIPMHHEGGKKDDESSASGGEKKKVKTKRKVSIRCKEGKGPPAGGKGSPSLTRPKKRGCAGRGGRLERKEKGERSAATRGGGKEDRSHNSPEKGVRPVKNSRKGSARPQLGKKKRRTVSCMEVCRLPYHHRGETQRKKAIHNSTRKKKKKRGGRSMSDQTTNDRQR